MPAALLGAVSCGRCGASIDRRGASCANCGVTLLDAASGAALGTYSGLLAGVAPVTPTRRRLAALVDAAAVLVPVLAGVGAAVAGLPNVAVPLVLIGVAVLAVQTVLLARRGRSIARRIFELRSVDDLTGMPVHRPRALAGLLTVGSARGTLTADFRLGRDPLRSGVVPLEADALGAEVTRPRGRRRATKDPLSGLGGIPDARIATVVLVLDSGTRIEVESSMLIGRTPTNPEGESHPVYALPDLSRSLSKTHALVEWTGTVLWVTDLHSANGTRLIGPDGAIQPLVPGLRGPAGLGWTIQLGDRSFVVHAGSVSDS